jgi:endoglucanase
MTTIEKNSLQSGVNLGGWISQYPVFDYHHFDTFITCSDIRRIADWGCDHVRLPVDYPVLEDENRPGVPNERGLDYVRRAMEWCQQDHLSVILDLHRAPGYTFNNFQAATLFGDPSQQERFLNLWESLAEQFYGTSDRLVFELLNEIVLPDSAPWNCLLQKAVDRIRRKDPERLIVIGGNFYNAASELVHLEILDDPFILYTFHFYEPMVVTHQKAHWAAGVFEYDRNMDYPGSAPHLDEFLASRPEFKNVLEQYSGKHLDKSTIRSYLQPALEFAQKSGQSVYCGEYGVIEGAPMEARINWTRDFVSLLRDNRIGKAVWSYKAMDFGLVDLDGKIVNDEIIKIVCAH